MPSFKPILGIFKLEIIKALTLKLKSFKKAEY